MPVPDPTSKRTGSLHLVLLEASAFILEAVILWETKALKDKVPCGDGKGQEALRCQNFEWRSHLGNGPSSLSYSSWWHVRWTMWLSPSRISDPQNHEQSKLVFEATKFGLDFYVAIEKWNIWSHKREINSKVKNREEFMEREFWKTNNIWMQKNS